MKYSAYHEALAIDEDFVEAWTELGYFTNAILDKPEEATQYFTSALAILRSQFEESIVGLVQCIAETQSHSEASRVLMEQRESILDKEAMKRITAKIEEVIPNEPADS